MKGDCVPSFKQTISNKLIESNEAIWIAGVYLMLLVQLLENTVIIKLIRTEFLEALKKIVQHCPMQRIRILMISMHHIYEIWNPLRKMDDSNLLKLSNVPKAQTWEVLATSL